MRLFAHRVARVVIGLAAGMATAVGGEPPPVVGRPVMDFEYAGEPPLFMPTAVAVTSDGEVFVADGVNDRIVHFARSGLFAGTIDSVGGGPLVNPLSVKVDGEDRLWIVDTGNARVVACRATGELLHELPAAVPGGQRPVDISDVALGAGGDVAWLVDNDNHSLIRLDAGDGSSTRVGQHGETLGRFDYPFMAVVASGGDVLVTDVINARIAVVNSRGIPVRSIATYGVQAGQLYRPKGIALGPQENVWVSDSVLGVVQVFSQTGALVGVLRDADGTPLRFEAPVGLAFDPAGALYVVEAAAHRVRKVDVTLNRVRPRPRGAQGAAGLSQQPKICTACHLEWLRPLDQGRSTELMDVPANPPALPHVSRSETCLSCHDGSVVDSRRRVWLEHGHRTGLAPPAEAADAGGLPLVDGNIACRTCHSAHTRAGSGNEFKDAVFLRFENDLAELCVSCHVSYLRGAAAGMHPLGPLEVTVSGANAVEKHGTLPCDVTCLNCHTGHGTRYEALLVRDPTSNDLCLSCHEELAPDLFGEEHRGRHGRLPPLDEQQTVAARSLGTRIGPRDELLCATCHQPHGALTTQYLLAFDPAAEAACTGCHAEQQGIVGSSHDLRTNHPDAMNIIGVTAQVGGACSGCHTAHRYAQVPRPHELDPQGYCMTCHAPERLATAKALGPVNHPEARCADCHDAHETRRSNYLAGQPSEGCRDCHEAHAKLAGGPHDLFRNPDAWPAVAADTQDACLACHRPHASEHGDLYRAGLYGDGVDAACLVCHQATTPGLGGDIALVHSRDAADLAGGHGLPVATAADGRRLIACLTCHDTHAGGAAGLLRVSDPASTEQLCLRCHEEMSSIRMIGHAPEWLREAGLAAESCGPCHRVHADPAQIEAGTLWPKDLTPAQASSPLATAADVYCIACHREGGPVAPPPIATHPAVAMFNPDAPGLPGYLPLFNLEGRVDANGNHACRTCHLTHGRIQPAPVSEMVAGKSSREVRARMWHIRTFAATNVCTTCHGFDALRRFMYFHDPARRTGPLEGTRRGSAAGRS